MLICLLIPASQSLWKFWRTCEVAILLLFLLTMEQVTIYVNIKSQKRKLQRQKGNLMMFVQTLLTQNDHQIPTIISSSTKIAVFIYISLYHALWLKSETPPIQRVIRKQAKAEQLLEMQVTLAGCIILAKRYLAIYKKKLRQSMGG